MINKKTLLIIIGLLIVFSGFGLYIYNQQTPKEEDILELEPTAATEPTEIPEKIQQKKIWIFGRSVMAGWFEYWGSDVQTPVRKNDYILIYKGLFEPPDIVEGFEEYINDLSKNEKPLVFFKLCFADFYGESQEVASDNLEENKKYIKGVYKIAKEKGLKLIIGNALPKVTAETDSFLKWNHREYNKWLKELEKKYPNDVIVFDFYNNLVDSSGNLKSTYAVGEYDSHLNEAAYDVLDKEFFELLKEEKF